MGKVGDFILMGAIIVIVIGLLTWGFIVKNTSEKSIAAGVNQTAQLSAELVDSNKTKYNNLDISGEQVVDTIKELNDDLSTTFYINVKTFANSDAGGTTFATTNATLPAKGTAGYINPKGTFKGSLVYDSNKVLAGIVFTQIK